MDEDIDETQQSTIDNYTGVSIKVGWPNFFQFQYDML
jgi:hypothetical protein